MFELLLLLNLST